MRNRWWIVQVWGCEIWGFHSIVSVRDVVSSFWRECLTLESEGTWRQHQEPLSLSDTESLTRRLEWLFRVVLNDTIRYLWCWSVRLYHQRVHWPNVHGIWCTVYYVDIKFIVLTWNCVIHFWTLHSNAT